jgi:hypothetical protein
MAVGTALIAAIAKVDLECLYTQARDLGKIRVKQERTGVLHGNAAFG